MSPDDLFIILEDFDNLCHIYTKILYNNYKNDNTIKKCTVKGFLLNIF